MGLDYIDKELITQLVSKRSYNLKNINIDVIKSAKTPPTISGRLLTIIISSPVVISIILIVRMRK